MISGAFIGEDLLGLLAGRDGVVRFRFLDSGDDAWVSFASRTFNASKSSIPIGEKSPNEDAESDRARLRDLGVLATSMINQNMQLKWLVIS